MILKKVRLKNFISHADSELEFPLGVSVIVGPNGAGKTSILDAIIFGLFGERTKGDKVEDLIRKGCGSAEVEVHFEQDAKSYVVKLLRKKKSLEASLERENFGTIAFSATEVQKEIEKIIGLDKDTALKSIIVRQGEIASIIEADPKERKKLLGKLIGIENLEKAWERMKDLIEYFKGFTIDYQSLKLKMDIQKERLLEDKKSLELIESELRNLESELMKEKIELDRAIEELGQIKDKRDKHESLTKELSNIKTEIKIKKESLENLMERIKRAIKAKKEAEELKKEIEKIPIVERILDIKKSLEKERALLEERLKELERISRLKIELDETKKAYEEYKKLEKEITELRNKVKELEVFLIRKTTIETNIKSIEDEIRRFSDEFDRIRQEALKYLPEVSIEEKNKLLAEIEKEKKDLEEKISQFEQQKGKLKGRKKEIEDYLKILGESNICPVCKSVLTLEHREKVKKDFQNEEQDISKTFKSIEKEIKDLNRVKADLETKIRALQRLDVERAIEIQKELMQKNEKLQELKKELEEIAPKILELENSKKQLEEREKRQIDLKEDYERYLSAKKSLESERDEREVEKEINEMRKKISELENEFEGLWVKIGSPEDIQGENKRLRSLKEKYDRSSAIAKDLESLEKEKYELKMEVERLENKEISIAEEIENLGFKEEELNRVEQICQEKSKKLTEISTKIEEKNIAKEKVLKEIESIEKEIGELNRELEKLEKIMNFIKDLEKIRTAFSRDGAQKLLRQVASPLISNNARRYVEKFNLDITDLIVSEDFDISVIKRGEEMPLSSLSGGERVAIAIALRFAIAKAMAGKLSTIIMDEPTTHLDEERRRELIEIMKSFFREGSSIPQMVIITHHRELEEVADTIYNVEKVDGVSKVNFVSSF